MVSDTFVLSAEAMSTAIIGPLSLLTVYLIASGSTYRHQCQAFVSTLHIYSDALYFATSTIDYYGRGINHCRPESYYFWGYYVGLNAIWIIVPAGISFIRTVYACTDLSRTIVSERQSLESGFCGIRPYGAVARSSRGFGNTKFKWRFEEVLEVLVARSQYRWSAFLHSLPLHPNKRFRWHSRIHSPLCRRTLHKELHAARSRTC